MCFVSILFTGASIIVIYTLSLHDALPIYIDSIGGGIDCSSVNEVKLALHAGVPVEKVLYTSNGISFDEIEEVAGYRVHRSEEHTSELQSRRDLVCRLLLEKKNLIPRVARL